MKGERAVLNHYLIDFENVGGNGIKNLTGMTGEDVVDVFYSEKCRNIPLDIIRDITKQNIMIAYHKVHVGEKNALDFQLSSYLGYLIGYENKPTNYYIVSNDRGYDCLCAYWKNKKKRVKRIGSVEPVNKEKNNSPSQNHATLKEIRTLVGEKNKPEEVLKIFNQHKTKVAIHNGLVKIFRDTKRARAIYKKLKPPLETKHKI